MSTPTEPPANDPAPTEASASPNDSTNSADAASAFGGPVPPELAATADDPDATDSAPPATKERRVRHSWLTFRYPGLVGALVMFALALTPSLLPRPWMYEALVGAVGALIGYGLGTLLWWVVRRIWKRPISPTVSHWGWVALAIFGPVVALVALIAGHSWQNQVRELVGEPEVAQGHVISIVLVGLAVFLVLFFIFRGIRGITRAITRLLGRFIPSALAQTVAVVVVALVAYWLVTGIAFDSAIKFADSTYSSHNEGTPDGVTQPTSQLRSGGPGSDVSWDSLGYQGRGFIGGGPTASEITQFTGADAIDPIRVYAGLESADTASERADLAVKELDRTGAWDRDVVIVAAATGTGWLEPAAVDSVEYLWGGNTAIASIQYSYLPSWISFLVDKERAADAGTELFDAVYAKWSALPERDRPQLIAYGLSLGSFAGQAAFASPTDMAARTDGALFLGSPSFSEPHGDIEKGREAGSPQWRPIYEDGVTVRFGGAANEFAGPSGVGSDTGWENPRVAYLQHANDPVVWWDPELILERPDWLAEAPGPDRTPDMHWIPFVTFLQVTVDQFFGTSVPDLQGHNYGGTMVNAWQAVVPAPGWTTSELDDLQKLIDSQSDD